MDGTEGDPFERRIDVAPFADLTITANKIDGGDPGVSGFKGDLNLRSGTLTVNTPDPYRARPR